MSSLTDERPYKCQLCPYSTYREELLIKHDRSLHSQEPGSKTYKCYICFHVSATRQNLVKHLMARHTGEAQHKCSFCPYSSMYSKNVREHERTHTGEKPLICKYCDYRSGCAMNLLVHERRHRGEKPYKCPLCMYRSVGSQDLKFHLRRHFGAKPVACKYCSYRGACPSDLFSHVKRLHQGIKKNKPNVQKSSGRQLSMKHIGPGFKFQSVEICLSELGVKYGSLHRCKCCGFNNENGMKLAAHYTLEHSMPIVRLKKELKVLQ